MALFLAASAGADQVHLKNGRVIEADRAWFEGDQVYYQKHGGVFGLPRDLVRDIIRRDAVAAQSNPVLTAARQQLAAGHPEKALELLEGAPDKRSPAVAAGLAEVHLKLGNPRAARQAASRAVALAPRSARAHAVLGDALAALGDHEGAGTQYRKSLLLKPDPTVERKLVLVTPTAPASATGARFRLRYDGGVNEPLGVALLQVLEAAYEEYSRRLGFHPENPTTVILQTTEAFQSAQIPPWAAGVNDGTIRIPVQGVTRVRPALVRTLRHELAHSFVAARTAHNCPTWLQEGIAQWIEGPDPRRSDARLAAEARKRSLIPLLSLEGPFAELDEGDAALAYAQSLSAVAHIERIRGEAGIVRLIAALGDGLPSEEALPVALALSYAELQDSWEAHLEKIAPPAASAPQRPPS